MRVSFPFGQPPFFGQRDPLEPLAVKMGELAEYELNVVQRKWLALVEHGVTAALSQLDVLKHKHPTFRTFTG